MSRSTIDRLSRSVALVVMVVGIALVIVPVVLHGTDVFDSDPFMARTETETIKKHAVKATPQGGESGTETTTTTKPAADSLIEQALGDGGLLVLRLALVLLAAFVAGAATQRILLARYAFKLAGLEVPDLKEAAEKSDESLQAVARQIVELQDRIALHSEDIAQGLDRDARLTERVRALVEKVGQLESHPPPTES